MKSQSVKINQSGALVYITFPKLTACNTVRHAFSTRLGGVSTGQFSSMNLGFKNGDKRENVEANYEILCDAVGIDVSHLVLSNQTHTKNVVTVGVSDRGTGFSKPPFCDVDGLITGDDGVALVTQYADCTPLLFCDPKRRVVATSHAGWRGTVQDIAGATVGKMIEDFGSKAEDIIAAVGPCIGQCCYEVDDPVYEAVSNLGLSMEGIITPKNNGKYMLDLREVNRRLLIRRGVLSQNIDVADLCTCCESDSLHSHRATGGKRGNLAAVIELKA